uniref:Uncharacterized protein n=1 Tax=Anser brachyrhynchus TaxID=132585 RepID=A0A8B9BVV1_9AVES
AYAREDGRQASHHKCWILPRCISTCGQQVPRNPPFTAVRITEGEMKSYHDFIGGCIRLELPTYALLDLADRSLTRMFPVALFVTRHSEFTA